MILYVAYTVLFLCVVLCAGIVYFSSRFPCDGRAG